MENIIDDYITQGYEIIARGENNAMLRRKTWGSAFGHLLLAMFTLGIGNLIYAFVAHNSAEKVMLKIDPAT